ncbi:MAG: enoyl-CoA hydratase/isomerase family protein [Betaproteobacteria bacterium]|nr:enoyl-CoA hydratase/isomerase family protein [Betaproteobacteria bacterium]
MLPIGNILQLERRGSAAWLWLNRPELRNALSGEMLGALAKALDELERDETARVLVLAGRGPAFCAGGDLSRMEQGAKMTKAKSKAEAARFAKLLYRMHIYPNPLIARVHGPAFAGGMGLVAACDLVIAAEEAEFCLPEVRIGLVPAMISPHIVRAMGEQQARRYFLTGERLAAKEAHRIGFVHECVAAAELDARVGKLATQLAQAGPQALARSKKMLAKVGGTAITPKLALQTAAVLADVRAGNEAREGIRAFLEKRRPGWNQD